jgi:3-hydroxyisobutyrate dehydrogenase-like beta-hydroxyacid dehydrogenase
LSDVTAEQVGAVDGPATADRTVVGVVGLGDMGAGIAGSILRAGFKLVAFDLRPQAVEPLVAAGASASASLEDLTRTCDVICVVVVNDAQVDHVVRSLLADPRRTNAIVVNSTVIPKTVVDLDGPARAAGVSLVDAPVSGGGEKGALGTLTVIVGGDADAVAYCRPVLDAIGSEILHVGPLGAGVAGKLVNNLLSLGGNALQIEAMQLADAYGISEDAATSIITVSAGDSRGIRTWGRLDRIRTTHTLAGTPEIYEIFAKDVRCAAVAAGLRGVTLPLTAVIGDLIGPKMSARDGLLEARGDSAPIPRCAICNQELAFRYREGGRHPECVEAD